MPYQSPNKSERKTHSMVSAHAIAAADPARCRFGVEHHDQCHFSNKLEKRHRAGWWCWLPEELEILEHGRSGGKRVDEICKEFLVKDSKGKVLFQRHHSAACLKKAYERGW